MISLPIAMGLAAAVLSTSFVSGIFGMAGGMILMGILLAMMPLAAAMVLHGLTQMASNGWRAWLWRDHVRWPVVASYAVGAVATAALLAAASIPLNKSTTLIVLGLMSFTGLLVPTWLAPNIVRRGDGVGCGVLCTALQLLSGVSGPIFDVFFIRSQLDRKQVVATKAAIQLLGHFLKVLYFGQLLAGSDTRIAPLAVAVTVLLAPVGTQLSRYALDAISDAQFRSWTRGLIAAIASIYLVQGLFLMLAEPQGGPGPALTLS
jgi:uncharacterized protein